MKRLLLTLPALFWLSLPPLTAQGFGGDDNLFIPPKLMVNSSMSHDPKPTILLMKSYRPDWMVLVPRLFFEYAGDLAIPERYTQFSSALEAREYGDSLSISPEVESIVKYREILNIVGYRMSRRPSSTLTLQGGYSAEASETAEVASERARVVREYLDRIWSIDTGRVTLMEPVMRADTFENNALQEEARRVDFASGDPAILAPVHFSREGISSIPSFLTITVTPNMDAHRVDSIILRMVDDKGDVHSSTAVAGHPDSINYKLNAIWTQSKSLGQEGLAMEAYIRTNDGVLRPSNRVFMPVEINEPPRENYKPSTFYATIPFQKSDSTVSPLQQEQIRDVLDWFATLLSISSDGTPEEQEYLLLATGLVDYAEHPGREAPEVNVKYQIDRAEFQSNMEEIKKFWSGQLTVMHLTVEDDGKDQSITYSAQPPEEHAEMRRKQEVGREDERYERELRPSLLGADSLADSRARSALRWIETLEVPTINDELPENAYLLKKGSFASTTELEGETGPPITSALREGLIPANNTGRHLKMTPEERTYSRGVRLELWTRENLKWMMKMMSR